MRCKRIAAMIAAAGLISGSARAAPESADQPTPDEAPGVIIFQLQPSEPGQEQNASEQEQAIMAMLLLQLLGAMEPQGEPAEVPIVAPSTGERI